MAYFGYNAPTDPEQSKYNAGALKIVRLNDSWTKCREAWRMADVAKLLEELELVWFELEADANKDELQLLREVNAKVDEISRKIIPRQLKTKLFFDVLREKWLILHRIEKHQGLGKKYLDASDEELD